MINTLLDPNSIAQQYSERVLLHIRETIEREGPIHFARYMQLALYASGLGYYSAGARKFGASGDFVTAPEISPLFSHCIAQQCAQILKDMKGGGCVLEIGAGSGVMALAMLRFFFTHAIPFERYFILEISADLRERQQQLLQQQAPEFLDKIKWLDRLPSEPIRGVIVANEVLDAMPVHKFIIQDEIREYYVTWGTSGLQWLVDKPHDKRLIEAIHKLLIKDEENYESEINLLLPSWIASLADSLTCGLILLVDYGFPRHEYYHPDRNTGTIMCHYQHRAHTNPFIYPGIQDITAHVDFTAVAEAAVDHGLTVSGFTHQAAFLLNCGILNQAINIKDEIEQYHLHQQIKRLTLPSEMGELFKVIALTKNYLTSLLGFKMMNQLERL